jgi:hypothetical protein
LNNKYGLILSILIKEKKRGEKEKRTLAGKRGTRYLEQNILSLMG